MQGNIISLGVTVVVLFIIPIIFFIVWKVKNKKNVKLLPLFIGAIGFIVSARVLEMIPHTFCILLDNPVSRFINGNTVAYVLYGIAAAGIFEECGRYIIIKLFMKKYQTRENIIMYGIGHGGIEVWSAIMPAIILYLIIAVMTSTNGVDYAMSALGVTEATKASFQPTLDAALQFNMFFGLLTIFERLVCMCIHIIFTIIVFYGIKFNQKRYLIYAILSHALFDVAAGLFQRGAIPMYVCEIWLAVWAFVFGFWAFKLYQKCKETSNDNKEAIDNKIDKE